MNMPHFYHEFLFCLVLEQYLLPHPQLSGEGGLIGPPHDIRYFSIDDLHNTVGTMELAHVMELASSLSNEILGMLYKEFRPDFFTDGSPAYWQQISKKK